MNGTKLTFEIMLWTLAQEVLYFLEYIPRELLISNKVIAREIFKAGYYNFQCWDLLNTMFDVFYDPLKCYLPHIEPSLTLNIKSSHYAWHALHM